MDTDESNETADETFTRLRRDSGQAQTSAGQVIGDWWSGAREGCLAAVRYKRAQRIIEWNKADRQECLSYWRKLALTEAVRLTAMVKAAG